MNQYNSIYEGLFSLYPKLNASGFIRESDPFPYCYLSQLSNTLDWKNSCLSRFERSIYQYSIYAESEKEVTDICKEIQNKCDWEKFNLAYPRKLTLLEFFNKSFGSPEPQVYSGRLTYTIIVEKQIGIDSTIIEADSITNGINKIWNFDESLVIDDWSRESNTLDNGSYCRIPGLNVIEGWLTSKSRIEQTNISLEIFSPGLPELINLINKVEDRYDYCKIVMPETHMIFEWESNSIEELEPQVWLGKINYTLLNEVLINDN